MIATASEVCRLNGLVTFARGKFKARVVFHHEQQTPHSIWRPRACTVWPRPRAVYAAGSRSLRTTLWTASMTPNFAFMFLIATTNDFDRPTEDTHVFDLFATDTLGQMRKAWSVERVE
ncbi:hypothetical protein SPBR_03345 [Sporothrix brasiliensis 5110]|uniref:Uncharacterized protein n=1 Tax=Sporothrix brasiliensis 5110 TaxID=1398154 RepID=A0A0C2ITC5_9PEZI|nr:uncharacterized protein SPBR_03345 [Sporothrix brasiliensis 5110]KIH92336.1 hypothetical protein SPBR_03345 [Sporothrix brasiliensis 5110]